MFTEKLHGPPGTGKTHALIERVRGEIDSGVAPEVIGYYSFTRAAAREAARRISADGQFPHFRTIHSECFRLLGLTRDEVMAGQKLSEFAGAFGYEISDFGEDQNLAEHEVRERVLKTLGDYLLFFEEWRKNLLLDTEQAYRSFMRVGDLPLGWSLPVVIKFQERYEGYKRENGLYDFSDMLLSVLREGLRPGVQVLVLDEAQDCSPLQFKVVDFWLQGVERHYIGGDPFQAIYQWQGARPELFEARQADKQTLLGRSFRLPQQVYGLSRRVIRESPAYQPRDAEGYIKRWPLERALDALEGVDGSAFLLVRNRYLLAPLVEELYLRGVPFGNLRGPSPFRGNTAGLILLLRRLLRNEPLALADLARLLEEIPQKPYLERGLKAEVKRRAEESPEQPVRLPSLLGQVTEAFTKLAGSEEYLDLLKMPARDKAYFRSVVTKYGEEVLTERPRLLLGTIHSVKGMEADHVVILADMAKRTWLGWEADRRAELRVWYVAATRARQGVILVEPRQMRCFQWPK
jgi:DNA helicase-2/ATP-dependent DNA helicase PcrA